jgi:hypothetical protein
MHVHSIKYVPLRQRAGTQKVTRRKLLVQHLVDNNVFEKVYITGLRAEASATSDSRKACDEVTASQKRESVSPESRVFRTSIDIGLASLDQLYKLRSAHVRVNVETTLLRDRDTRSGLGERFGVSSSMRDDQTSE